MILEGVDPRDIAWAVEHPVYRVYLWHHPPALPEVPAEQIGYQCDEYRIREAANVQEVIEWASRTARSDQTFTLYVEHHDLAGWGLIHLAGTDPTIAR